MPREPAGDAPNETPGTKSSGKKEKEAKGSGKKGQDGKGNKGNKGDPPGAPLQHLSGRTPWPPSLVLAELVDVVSAGGSSQVHAKEGTAARRTSCIRVSHTEVTGVKPSFRNALLEMSFRKYSNTATQFDGCGFGHLRLMPQGARVNFTTSF